MNAQDWAARYEQQAGWTRDLRNYLFAKLKLPSLSRVLEVGCGSGAVLKEYAHHGWRLYGLDKQLAYLALAGVSAPETHLAGGDALSLPFPANTFSLCFCHYFLLWTQPEQALIEMRRVTQPGGTILALAEPDYGGRVDYPQELVEVGRLQTEGLQNQGADPLCGRKLRAYFQAAGLADIQAGVMGGNWSDGMASSGLEQEWATLRNDLAGRIDPQRLSALQSLDLQAWQDGVRILYVPTFYASGRVK